MHEERINKTLQEMYERETAYDAALINAVDADFDYKVAEAQAFLKAEGNVEERKRQALLAVAEQYKAHLIAEATKTIMKVKVDDCRQALSARQTMLSAEVRIHNQTSGMMK